MLELRVRYDKTTGLSVSEPHINVVEKSAKQSSESELMTTNNNNTTVGTRLVYNHSLSTYMYIYDLNIHCVDPDPDMGFESRAMRVIIVMRYIAMPGPCAARSEAWPGPRLASFPVSPNLFNVREKRGRAWEAKSRDKSQG